MKEMGRVIHSDKDNAEILVMRESACGGHCDKCASSCNSVVTIITNNEAHVSPGDIVEIETEASTIVGLAAMFYIIPLIFIVIGVLVSKWLWPLGVFGISSDIAAVLLGAVFCAISLIGIKMASRGREIDYHITKV